MNKFAIRPAEVAYDDAQLLIAFFNSQVDYLPTIGSVDQWTEHADSNRSKKAQEWVSNSHASQGQSFNEQFIRAFIAEVEITNEDGDEDLVKMARRDEDAGSLWLPVGGLVLDAKSPDYVRSILAEQDPARSFIYLAYLISDRRTSKVGKGAGAALIAYAREEAMKAGVNRICLDCYAGNDRGLVKYYESQGFTSIGDFMAGDKKNWPGTVLEMKL